MDNSSYYKIIFTLLFFYFICCSCITDEPNAIITIDNMPNISPDYSGINIPSNIAPLNFRINEGYEKYFIKFYTSKETLATIWSSDGDVIIPHKKWKTLLEKCRGQEYTVKIVALRNNQWSQFQPFSNFVSHDAIDKYLVFRLIEPGFETWGEMGIYQRCLENFSREPIIENRATDKNCMNCHSFCNNSSELMLFHVRAKHSGTVFWKNKTLTKVDTETDETISAGVYPSWHPEGRFVAFSVNNIVQTFHSVPEKKVEVLDTLSDLILYDTEKNLVSTCPDISSPDYFETFPTWSPDGRSLFFCRAKALPPENYDKIRYDLYKIDFSPLSKTFGKLTLVVNLSEKKQSITFPRVSPDGKYLLFCVIDYGNFSIWHNESDLYCLNLENGEIKEAKQLNSASTESYHSWSQNGKWIVYSSRRHDGLYTKPFISHFDGKGNFTKPFILPQKSPDYYSTFLKSYNIPEFVTSKAKLSTTRLAEFINADEVEKAEFDIIQDIK